MKKRVIGITGGVGSGKSRILELLRDEWGAEVIQADRVAAQLEEPGEPGLAFLISEFGTGILDADGRLDRGAFAARIFSDPTTLARVNALLHPLVYAELERRVGASSCALVAVEAALFDCGHKALFDELWFVDTDVENRIRRLMESRGYSREKCLDVMKNQPSREAFLSMADRVIDNNGLPDEIRRQLCSLLGGPPR